MHKACMHCCLCRLHGFQQVSSGDISLNIACHLQMPGSFGPVGNWPPAGGPSMQMPPAMAYAKGPSFMQAQQQRMEVTVPVPEARVRPSLHVRTYFSDKSFLSDLTSLKVPRQKLRHLCKHGCSGLFVISEMVRYLCPRRVPDGASACMGCRACP
jgi:hypothetical protein